MPCHESPNVSIAEDGTLKLSYFVWEVIDEQQAEDMVYAKAPPIYNRRLRTGRPSLQSIGRGVWEAEVDYTKVAFDIGGVPPPDPGGPPADIVEFDTGGGTQHITTAISQGYAPSHAPNMKNAIGVSNGTVEGCDIVIPKLALSLTKHLSFAFVTPEYIKNLARLTGKTNSQQYGVFEEGELLFLGARGSARGLDYWEITLQFEASQNNPNLQVAPGIVVDKFGHEYLWVLFKSVKEGQHIVQQPEFAYVAKVYESEDFFQVLGF
jgi:hypothetical protein